MYQKISLLHKSLYAALLVALIAVTHNIKAEPVDVYLFGGQSNQQGIAKVDQLPQEQRRPISGVSFWNGKSFETLRPEKTRISARPGEFGPEIGFALSLRETNDHQRVAIIKHWVSGTGLDAGWDNARWLGDTTGPKRLNFYPGLTAEDPHQGKAYTEMLARYKRGLSALKASDRAYVIKGLVWVQGEQDAKHARSASRYAENLARLSDRLHEDLGLERGAIPIVFAQSLGMPPTDFVPGTGKQGDKPTRFTHWKELRSSMSHADAGSGHDDAISNAWMVSTDGLALTDDVHYNADGQIELGRRLFSRFSQITDE